MDINSKYNKRTNITGANTTNLFDCFMRNLVRYHVVNAHRSKNERKGERRKKSNKIDNMCLRMCMYITF